jgi:hypothetical protein
MIQARRLVVLAFVMTASATVLARQELQITPIVSEGRVLTSITAREAWKQGTREVLQTGYQVSFEFQVELRRPAPFWFFDPVLARVRITSLAKFNTLTGAYQVTRLRNGHAVDSRRLSSESEVRDWLTTFNQVALDPVAPLEPNGEYYVYVQLTTSPRRSFSLWSLLPFGREENSFSGRKYFTYIR